MSEAFDDLRFAVIDVEGNGQPPEIIEIAIQPMTRTEKVLGETF